MNLDAQWLQAKAKYDSAVKQYGKRSRVVDERAKDLAEINHRRMRRDLRKGKAA